MQCFLSVILSHFLSYNWSLLLPISVTSLPRGRSWLRVASCCRTRSWCPIQRAGCSAGWRRGGSSSLSRWSSSASPSTKRKASPCLVSSTRTASRWLMYGRVLGSTPGSQVRSLLLPLVVKVYDQKCKLVWLSNFLVRHIFHLRMHFYFKDIVSMHASFFSRWWTCRCVCSMEV